MSHKGPRSSSLRGFLLFENEIMGETVSKGGGTDFAVFDTKDGAYRMYKFFENSGVRLLQKAAIIDMPPVL